MSSNYLYDALARSQRMLLLYSRLIFAKRLCSHLLLVELRSKVGCPFPGQRAKAWFDESFD